MGAEILGELRLGVCRCCRDGWHLSSLLIALPLRLVVNCLMRTAARLSSSDCVRFIHAVSPSVSLASEKFFRRVMRGAIAKSSKLADSDQ
jgi:hypothetical protein